MKTADLMRTKKVHFMTNFRFFQTKRVYRRQFHMKMAENSVNGNTFGKGEIACHRRQFHMKMAENSVNGNTFGKGEIACHKQFLLFLQCFPKTCTSCRHVKTRACIGKG